MTLCHECPNHFVISDRDPNDWFNDDDVALVCKLMPVTPKKDSKYLSDHSAFKVISSALRPYEVVKTPVPVWCPLKKEKHGS